MLISIYRHGKPMETREPGWCFRHCRGPEATEMVTYALRQKRAVLVGIDDEQVVLKPQEADDARESYVSLYDTAISLLQFRKMMRLEVSSPEQFPQSLYGLPLRIEIEIDPPPFYLMLLADSDADVGNRLDKMRADPQFILQISDMILDHVRETVLEKVTIYHVGSKRLTDDPPDGTEPWALVRIDQHELDQYLDEIQRERQAAAAKDDDGTEPPWDTPDPEADEP